MALIKCPNCGADISDKAYKCPKCGKELRVIDPPQNVDSATGSKTTKENSNEEITLTRRKAIFFASLFAVVLIVLVAAFAYLLGTKNATVDSSVRAEIDENEDIEITKVEIQNNDVNSFSSQSEEATEGNKDISIEKEEVAEPVDYSSVSPGMQKALQEARQILSITAYSYQGLIDRLRREQFTDEEAKYGADSCGADWKEEAVKDAKNILSVSAYSYQGMIDRLGREQFTDEEAKYGADNCGADWNEQAKKEAETVLSISTYSKDELRARLQREGFTESQIEYALKNINF